MPLLTANIDDGRKMIACNAHDSYRTWPRIEKSHIDNPLSLLIGSIILLIQKIACFPVD